jgi:hypothetical protein
VGRCRGRGQACDSTNSGTLCIRRSAAWISRSPRCRTTNATSARSSGPNSSWRSNPRSSTQVLRPSAAACTRRTWARTFSFSPDRGPGVHLERLHDQGEQLPPTDSGEGLEHGVPQLDAPVRVGPVVDPSEPLQVPGVQLGHVSQVGRDQGVVAHPGRRLPEQPVGHRGHVSVLAGQVPAEPLFAGVDVSHAASSGGQWRSGGRGRN